MHEAKFRKWSYKT